MRQNKISITKSYYQLVDKGKLLQMYELFASDIFYKRCEEEMVGIEQFKNFYEQDRKIRGKHSVSNVLSKDNLVVIQGQFQGVDGDQNPICLCFVDTFEFDTQLKIYKRYTYLAVGFNMTK